MYSLFLLGISSFLIAFFLTPFVRNLSRRWGVVDHPDGRRKVHTAPIPRVGGIAILLAYCGAFGVLLAFGAIEIAPGLVGKSAYGTRKT